MGKGLTRERVLEAALALADAEGLDALSMRRLGQALGVEAMSLYRHVADKEDLLDGLHGAVLAGLPPLPSRGGWRARAEAAARGLREALRRHPRLALLFASRPAVAPASLALFDAVLGVLEEAGLSRGDALRGVHALLAYVVGSCLWHGAIDRGPTAEAVAGHPRVAAAFSLLLEEGWDQDAEFELGLAALLDGLAARVRRGRR